MSLEKMNFVTFPTTILCCAAFSMDGGFCFEGTFSKSAVGYPAAWEPWCRKPEDNDSQERNAFAKLLWTKV